MIMLWEYCYQKVELLWRWSIVADVMIGLI